MARPPGRRALSAVQQALAIRSTVPGARITLNRSELTAELEVRPTRFSRLYTLKICYRRGRRPRVTVISPELKLHPDAGRLPHTYQGTELCLHLPGEWHSDMQIAHTIIPWASEWLFHYEIWLITGEWHGGDHDG